MSQTQDPTDVATVEVLEAASLMTSLELHTAVMIERIQGLSGLEQIAAALGVVEALKRLATAAQKALNAKLAEEMNKVGVKQVLVGDQVAKKMTREKVQKPKAGFVPVIEAALEVYEGDVAQLANLIASDGIKPGALAKLVGQRKFDELYSTEWRDIVRNGKPVTMINWIPKHLLEGDADAAE
jgi:signal transduction histidine kinase